MSFADAKKMSTLCRLEVVRSEQVSPNFRRITVGGSDLAELPEHGFDHWFRMFLPQEEGETSFELPEHFDLLGYLKYLRIPGANRPHLRNYTVRSFRKAELELDIDFVVHGDEGVATRWAQRTKPGDRFALLDQGCGYDQIEADQYLLVGDETALPAIAGILRDMPRSAEGLAVIEVPDAADMQETDAPAGVEVRYLVRDHHARPGTTAIASAQSWTPTGTVSAYLAGEQQLPTTLRRWLVNEHGVSKKSIAFTGYWKLA